MLSNVKEYCIGFTMGLRNSIIMSSIKTKKRKKEKNEYMVFSCWTVRSRYVSLGV